MARFSHRPKRIARRNESEKFERLVMPAAFMCFPIGVALLIGAGLAYAIHGSLVVEMLVIGALVFAVPGILQIYRFLRGHFSSQLEEP